MNDIAKQNIVARLIEAMHKETVTAMEVANIFGIHNTYISSMRNPKQWHKVPQTAWDAAQKWANSGLSLVNYKKKIASVPVPDNKPEPVVQKEAPVEQKPVKMEPKTEEPERNIPEPAPKEAEPEPKRPEPKCAVSFAEISWIWTYRRSKSAQAIARDLNINLDIVEKILEIGKGEAEPVSRKDKLVRLLKEEESSVVRQIEAIRVLLECS